MARTRNIKPAFFLDEDLASLPPHARLLYIGLWCIADKNGVLEDRPLWVKAQIFPYENLDINGLITVISPWITRYSVDGKSYIRINNFIDHQNPHHTEKESGFPLNGELTVKTPLEHRENPALNLIPYTSIPSTSKAKGSNKKTNPLSLKTKSTIQSWEASFGKLSIEHLGVWVEENNLSPDGVKKELEIFRNKCEAKGYEYVNFPAAFKDWGCDKEKCKKKVSVDEFNRLQREKWEV
jgi:hypothetical protein